MNSFLVVRTKKWDYFYLCFLARVERITVTRKADTR